MAWAGPEGASLSAEPGLVAIDEGGVARPLDETSRAAFLRAGRAGFELLPAPARALVLRSSPGESTGSCIVGQFVSPSRLHDLFAMLAHSHWCGELVVCSAEATRSIVVHNGSVVGATSSAAAERLGAILVHFGEMTAAQVEQTARAVGEGVRFGDAAVRLGFINRETLFHFLLRQVEMVVYETMAVARGTFSFAEAYDESQLPVLLNQPLSALILEGARRLDEMGMFRRHIPSAEHIPVRVDTRSVDPSHEAYPVFLAVNGVRTVADVAVAIGREEFDTTRMLYQLIQGGAVSLRHPRTGGAAGALAAFNDAMTLIFGSLGDNERAREDVRASLASFSASSPAHEVLFREAGPAADGTFDVGQVLHNLARAAESAQPLEALLDTMLHEYASFAVFIAEPAMRTASRADAADVARRVAEVLAPLAPEV